MRYTMEFNGTEYFIYDTQTMQIVYSSSIHGEDAKRRTEQRLSDLNVG